ncbi:MAG: hypothetical protein BYD32DRAFT_459788 [Podila humilis]|nr:MAG: hypothetical protein BYD32DRAFT_459788 [Podila humilis]
MIKRALYIFMMLALGALLRPSALSAAEYNPKEVDIEVIPCRYDDRQSHVISTYVTKEACTRLPFDHRGNATCTVRVALYVGGGYGGQECPRFGDSACETKVDHGDYFVCHGPPVPKP